jgi:nucleoside-diphosphate-sugar epimerase
MVYHCAGYAHTGRMASAAEADRHWRVNALGTRNLAEAAGQAGVSRFVFLSSVKAVRDPGVDCVDESWDAPPTTPYGRAKRQAEQWLLEAGERYGMQVVTLRPSMVYGAGGRGNLPRMIEAILHKRFPPLPRVRNRRSMVHVDDLVQAALLAADRPEAAGRTYLVTDGLDYSTGEIYQAIRAALGLRPARWQFPPVLLRLIARAGDALCAARLPVPLDTSVIDRLLSSECYRSDRIRRELGYQPSRTLWDALPEIVASLPARDAA